VTCNNALKHPNIAITTVSLFKL